MKKDQALLSINRAKAAHLRWLSYAQALLSGVEVTDDKLPLKHTDCQFGLWYHSEGKTQLGHMATFDGIEIPHQMLHEIYARLFKVLYGEDDRSALLKLFTSKRSHEKEKYDKGRQVLLELMEMSDTLLKAVELFENEVRDSKDPTFSEPQQNEKNETASGNYTVEALRHEFDRNRLHAFLLAMSDDERKKVAREFLESRKDDELMMKFYQRDGFNNRVVKSAFNLFVRANYLQDQGDVEFKKYLAERGV